MGKPPQKQKDDFMRTEQKIGIVEYKLLHKPPYEKAPLKQLYSSLQQGPWHCSIANDFDKNMHSEVKKPMKDLS